MSKRQLDGLLNGGETLPDETEFDLATCNLHYAAEHVTGRVAARACGTADEFFNAERNVGTEVISCSDTMCSSMCGSGRTAVHKNANQKTVEKQTHDAKISTIITKANGAHAVPRITKSFWEAKQQRLRTAR